MLLPYYQAWTSHLWEYEQILYTQRLSNDYKIYLFLSILSLEHHLAEELMEKDLSDQL